MQLLGQIVVIQRKCLSCDQEVNLDNSFHEVFCCYGCYLKWMDELAKPINESYQWHTDISNSNHLIWVKNDKIPNMRDWSE